MKILYVMDPGVKLTEPFDGGTEAFVVNLSNQMSLLGHKIDILAGVSSEAVNYQLKELSESPFSMRDDIHSEYEGQVIYKELQYGLMDTSQYDIIHYHSFNPKMYEMGSFHNQSTIVTLHLPVNDKLSTAIRLFAERTKSTFVGISNRSTKSWQAELDGQKVETVLNGISLANWEVSNIKKDYLLWAGRINENKNPHDAILLAQHNNASLVIAGKIENQLYFDTYVYPYLNEKIKYVGHLSQVELCKYANESIANIVTATWEEPFGLTIIEMLACGIPVIGYDSAIPEEFRKLSTVLTTHHQTIESLSLLLKNTKNISSTQCRKDAERFSIYECAKRYDELYRSFSKDVL